MIKVATYEDMDAMFKLGQENLDRQYGRNVMRVDEQEGRRELRQIMSSATGVAYVDYDSEGQLNGCIIGQVVKQSFVKNRFVTDLAFFVREDKPITAVKLLRHFIDWGRKQKNINEVIINVSSGLGDTERMKTMYEKLGLRWMGGCFCLELGKVAAAKAA